MDNKDLSIFGKISVIVTFCFVLGGGGGGGRLKFLLSANLVFINIQSTELYRS